MSARHTRAERERAIEQLLRELEELRDTPVADVWEKLAQQYEAAAP